MEAFAILRIMSGRAIPFLALLAALVCAASARADEIRLKDGTKISGTIVGFEDNSFRVETSYGFALVLKDKVADISISATKKELEPKSKSSASATAPSAAKPTAPPAVEKETPSATNPPTVLNASATARPLAGANASLVPAKNEPTPVKIAATPAPPTPPAPPEPPAIR